MSRYLLGVDVGTNETKGVLIDENYRPVAEYAVAHVIENPKPSFYEMDAEIWWSDFCTISHGLLEKSGVKKEDVVGIGTSVMGCDCIPVDENCKPLRKAILYGIDARSAPQIEWLLKEWGEEKVVSLYGHIPKSDDISAKILWVKEEEPEIHEKAYKFLTGSSYMTAKLTGQYTIDQYLAKVAFRPIYKQDGTYDEINGPFFCREDQMAKPMRVSDVAGGLTEEAAAQCGLNPGTPVIVGTGDSTAESVAGGLMTPGTMFCQFGSTLFYIFLLDGLMDACDEDGFAGSRPFTIPDSFACMGGTNAAGTMTKWVRDNWYQQELEAEKNGGENTFAYMAKEAAEVAPGSKGLIVLPYIEGERSPIHDPKAKGVFFGLTREHTRKEITRAVLEGVAYSLGSHIRIFRNHGLDLEEIIVAGGGTKNALWMQIAADVTGLPIRVAESWQSASYGDACMAAIGCGMLKDFAELKAAIPAGKPILPNMENHELYQKYLTIYETLYQQTKELMHQLP